MRIAVLVKQIPAFEEMELGPDGRLVREGVPLELNAYCRRAVAAATTLVQEHGGSATVITLGPPPAEDCLREAVAWGCDHGVLVTDRAFAGSDTLATARALAAALDRLGPFDLVLTGRNSVDADTGQVGPQVAELLGLPFLCGARELRIEGSAVQVRCEEDDGTSERRAALPALVSCAERLCDPAKVPPDGRAAVDPARLSVLTAADLGPGPWGEGASGTYVGEVRVLAADRDRKVLEGPVADQVAEAVALLSQRHALAGTPATEGEALGPVRAIAGPAMAVVVEPGRDHVARELLGAAARLAAEVGGHVVALAATADGLAAAGADRVVVVRASVEDDVAATIGPWVRARAPWAVLLPSTTWGREVGGRVAAAVGAGLTGDAVDLEVSTVASTGEQRLLAWKPAFGGQLVAAIYCSSPVQMATVRAGVIPAPASRDAADVPVEILEVVVRGRVDVLATVRDDDLDVLAGAEAVVGVGAGVDPAEYGLVHELAGVLGAEVAATRKVTDKAWMPRARQVGITGRAIAPRLYVAVGLSGKFNHTVGVRAAGTVVAINNDPSAPVFDHADIGIVGDWREVVPLLTAALRAGS